jgi:dihydroflavonol-4-reductase
MNKPTVLITGISGFIAKHCAVEMLNAGYAVRGTVRSLQRAGEVRDSLARHADVAQLTFAQADLEGDAGWNERSPAVRTCCTSRRRSPRSSRGTSRS